MCFWQVIIKFGDREINKSPFSVKVEGAAGDPTKVTASGPGLEKTGVIATKRTYFEVFTKSEFMFCLAVYLYLNKNKILKIVKTMTVKYVSCYAILKIYSSSFMVLLYVWIFYIKKNNASQRELTQSWFMCISIYISIHGMWYNELVD